MAIPKIKSGAQKVDAAFNRLCALRKKFGFPQVRSPEEANETWHVTYSMPHSSVAEARSDAKLVYDTFGKIPWEHDPNKE